MNETIEANQIETSGNPDEIIILENQEKEPSMDCWSWLDSREI